MKDLTKEEIKELQEKALEGEAFEPMMNLNLLPCKICGKRPKLVGIWEVDEELGPYPRHNVVECITCGHKFIAI